MRIIIGIIWFQICHFSLFSSLLNHGKAVHNNDTNEHQCRFPVEHLMCFAFTINFQPRMLIVDFSPCVGWWYVYISTIQVCLMDWLMFRFQTIKPSDECHDMTDGWDPSPNFRKEREFFGHYSFAGITSKSIRLRVSGWSYMQSLWDEWWIVDRRWFE